MDQHKYPTPKCWLQILKEHAAQEGLELDIDKIQATRKQAFKKEVKEYIQAKVIKEIQMAATKKMEIVLKGGFGKKKYIEDGKISMADISTALKIRLNMINIPYNFGNPTTRCQFCRNEIETTEHILIHCECLRHLRTDVEISESRIEEDETDSVEKMLKIYKRINKVMIYNTETNL